MEDYLNFTFSKSYKQWNVWLKLLNKLYGYDKKRSNISI